MSKNPVFKESPVQIAKPGSPVQIAKQGSPVQKAKPGSHVLIVQSEKRKKVRAANEVGGHLGEGEGGEDLRPAVRDPNHPPDPGGEGLGRQGIKIAVPREGIQVRMPRRRKPRDRNPDLGILRQVKIGNPRRMSLVCMRWR